jgi:hypothetical protein
MAVAAKPGALVFGARLLATNSNYLNFGLRFPIKNCLGTSQFPCPPFNPTAHAFLFLFFMITGTVVPTNIVERYFLVHNSSRRADNEED